MSSNSESSAGLIARVIAGIVVLGVGIWFCAGAFTTVGADEYVIKQDLVSGELHDWNTPGVH